jgi:protein-L-isoaspartate(D-aspartate) O-methyltransferase
VSQHDHPRDVGPHDLGQYDDRRQERDAMVRQQIAGRGIHHPAVLDALRAVPREAFVPDEQRDAAYLDSPLPLGHGQTISQPYVVALMIELLDPQPGDRVLEVGGGSGYAAAVLSRVVGQVYTIERLDPLCERARSTLQALGYHNVEVRCADGSLGWEPAAPYDGILVAAGGPDVPSALKAQLAIGGRLVIPVGDSSHQQILVRVTREGDDDYRTEQLAHVAFVPLIGAAGWRPSQGHGAIG